MLERLKNLKTTAAGLVAGIIAIVGIVGFDLTPYSELLVSVLGVIGTIVGLFAKD